jgi:adenine-specific DNA-methyltransferase
MSEIEKLDLRSMDIIGEQKEKLRQLFPEIFTEDKIDFEKLKLALGEAIEVGKERYGMTWPGKADCFKIIQNSSIGTLKPYREKSVNFDTTENLFIEGDNLEVLKLLQKSYYGKVKMIYIDPPYNTGNDFIYPDDYKENLTTYLQYTGQVDAEGKKFSTNTDTEGRFHSKWLNMMYPRLFLAKNLLCDNGVIFISIDDNEVSNLRKICDEIFGEENFVAQFPWRKRTAKSDVPFGVSQDYEWILCYAKSNLFIACIKGNKRKYYETLDLPNRPWRIHDMTTQRTAEERPNSNFTIINPKTKHKYPVNPNAVWRITKETFKQFYEENKIIFPGDYDFLNISKPVLRYFKEDDESKAGKMFGFAPVSTNFPKNVGMTQDGTKDIANLFKNKIFAFPKPTSLLKHIIKSVTSIDKSAIILDFFSGTCTTAHAVIDLNKEDGGNRKFIMVQLPEICNENSEAYKAGYKTIADIGKERIRRVIKNIEKETDQALFKNKKMDLGFKVFKLDKSNFKIWDTEQISPDKASIEKQLELHIDHIDPKASQEDILFEILLKAGYKLTTKIEKKELAGKTVYSIEGGAMLICLEKELTKEAIKAMAEKQPSRVICLDQGFANNDQLKTNAVQIMKSKGVDDFRTV